jgi:hypothetical protein
VDLRVGIYSYLFIIQTTGSSAFCIVITSPSRTYGTFDGGPAVILVMSISLVPSRRSHWSALNSKQFEMSQNHYAPSLLSWKNFPSGRQWTISRQIQNYPVLLRNFADFPKIYPYLLPRTATRKTEPYFASLTSLNCLSPNQGVRGESGLQTSVSPIPFLQSNSAASRGLTLFVSL